MTDAKKATPVVLNATQHTATDEQILAGVMARSDEHSAEMQKLLTFDSIPSHLEMWNRANLVMVLLHDMHYEACMAECIAPVAESLIAMIGGAPFFMPVLADVLEANGITPVYAFSERVSEEQHMADGSVRKVNVFKHVGFVGL